MLRKGKQFMWHCACC